MYINILKKIQKHKQLIFIIIAIIILCGITYLIYNSKIEPFTVNPEENNVYIYWVGPVHDFILYLRKLMYLHSNNGKNYKVHFINRENINNYLDTLPEIFDKLSAVHQADYVRIAVVKKYGGIWLDSDTIVMNDLSSMFQKLKDYDGFFVSEDDGYCNGVFGSKANTELINDWYTKATDILNEKNENMSWTSIGSKIINTYKNQDIIRNYYIYDGPNTVYPIHYGVMKDSYNVNIDNIKKYERDDQPVVILVWSGIKNDLIDKDIDFFFKNDKVLGYFLNKSLGVLNITLEDLKKYNI